MPEIFLDLPEVCRLAREGGVMHFTEGREPFDIVAAEEEVDILVGVHAEKLPGDLHGKDLGVGKLRWR
ncbi:MAG TPA: hypothetical protein VFE21_04810 [Rubrobacteraceae bacterium]|nr:hypothetical protein [Rubrobacteraceae bacterium]